MNEMKQIQELLKQNQKIIRFASQSLDENNLDEDALLAVQAWNNNLSTFEMTIEGFRSSITEYGEYISQSLIEITQNGIRLCVRKNGASSEHTSDLPTSVQELNSELTISGNAIIISTKKFIVDTQNFKLTEQGDVTITGEVHGNSCVIGGFSINSNTMTGNSNSTIRSGTITSNNMVLHNAIANDLYLNPGEVHQKSIYMTGCKSLDTDEKDYTNTEMNAVMDVIGNVKVTNGWDDSEHGTMPSIEFGALVCGTLWLATSASNSSIQPYNRLYCWGIENEDPGNYWSDERLKHRILDIDARRCGKLWRKLQPASYRMKETNAEATGYIAQDMREALTDAGMTGIVSRPNRFYAVSYPEMQALRIKQIQENQRKIERLRNENCRPEHSEGDHIT